MKITRAFTFEAAHRLPTVPATQRRHRVHGHSYRVELTVEGPFDHQTGRVVDFHEGEAVFARLPARLDHPCLNGAEGLEIPTAERTAVWIRHRLHPGLPGLARVRVAGTPMARAEHDGD